MFIDETGLAYEISVSLKRVIRISDTFVQWP